MDLLHISLLALTGVAAGVIAAVVGGASLVTYPVLIALGMPPITAAVTTNVALVPSNFAAALADRKVLPPLDRGFVRLVVASVLGAAVGAGLLMATPERVFALIVPLLLGFATLMFAYSGQIAEWMRARAERSGRALSMDVTSVKFVLPVSFYGGYFGSGVGILMLGVLSVATRGDYRTANVAKNLITSLNSAVATLVYVAQGAVPWPSTLALMVGAMGGGLIGSWVARILPRRIVRIMVIGFGVVLTAEFVYRFWL
ncbi:MAG: sulfite exporter TauE/SafE family protein [Rhizobiales bacterium]|nr:sulfite exporter TauE/SafE family protein [Hyphomicrobiales bacterium]OJY45571.1 MAG: hypothetical protein BGP08_17675 [Rhizobiales bacterium 64-17]